jgi:uncharacterized RDD family membrane protein YckC
MSSEEHTVRHDAPSRTRIDCVKCGRTLEFAGECPAFCAYCGQALAGTLDTPSASDVGEQTQITASDRGAAPDVPQTVGGYRLGRELGAGGMGAVYEAVETGTGRRVALKLITPAYSGSGDAVDRFRQEGRIASMVAHSRCVFVLAVDEEAGRPYIVMELMPGSTLKDLVDRRGRLSPADAVAKIMDVIEGLQAAHRLDVIHRDVKPSNCFLEADGRVKVGDFGLAKSLVTDSHLTQTGAFVGTPHFASPEQIKSEAIDVQTDVYSVAATLYYLLTGKPPFYGPDSAATLARIVSDPAPPLRSLRPELSPALESVVMRGLERDRSKRWPDLESLRQALVGLTPPPLSLADLGARAAAAVLDGALLWAASLAIIAIAGSLLSGWAAGTAQALLAGRVTSIVVIFVYFLVLERSAGCSLGKGVLGLQVCSASSVDPPSWPAAGLRSLVFTGLIAGGALASALALWFLGGDERDAGAWRSFGPWGWGLLGTVLMVSTMRAANGYRGLHEIVSGTRVIRPFRPAQREALLGSGGWLLSFLHNRRLNQGVAQPGALPARIGGFAVRGALKWSRRDKVLLGEDAALGRRAFIWLRPASEPPLDPARRDVGRRTRLRWLGCGKQGEFQWDAILAPNGCPLPEFVHSEGAYAWPEARALLAELAREMSAACSDGTLPANLTPAQVWVQGDGRAQLADIALTATTPELAPSSPTPERVAGGEQSRALGLLAQVAALVLEGKPPPLDAAPAMPRATLPPEARGVVERLLGVRGRCETVEQLLVDLGA